MAIDIPTTTEINEQNISNFEVRIGQTIPTNDRAFVRVLSAIEAGLFTSHYKYAVDRILQNLALTATGDDLDRIGTNYRVYRKAAIAWVGTIDQPAANGTTIPITVDYVADASGIRYIVNAAAVAAGGSATVSVTAAEPGENGSLSASDTLTIGRQIAGITSTTATFASTVTAGVDRETDTEYRRRILNEIRTVGGGGNSADYRTWAEAVTGVSRVFPFAGAPVDPSHKILDPDMEYADASFWTAGNSATLSKTTSSPQAGSRALRVTYNAVNNPYAYQDALEIGRDYTIDGYARSDGSSVPTVREGSTVLWTGTTSTAWQSFSVAFTATANDIRFRGTLSGAGYADFDSLELTVTDSLPGDRVVYVEATTDVDADGIPTETLLESVRTALNTDPDTSAERMPLGLTDEKLFVEPIDRVSFDVEIDTLTVDASQELACQTSLTDGLDEYFRAAAPFVEGVDSELDKADVITGVAISEVVQGILDAYGATADGLTFEVTGAAPITRYTLDENETAKLGTITYV